LLKVRPGAGAQSDINEGGEGKKYTLLLKDNIPDKRPDGRERSAVCWEVDFRAKRPAGSEGTTIRHYFKWSDFRATYRGRDCPGPEKKKLDIARIKRIGFMVRRYVVLLLGLLGLLGPIPHETMIFLNPTRLLTVSAASSTNNQATSPSTSCHSPHTEKAKSIRIVMSPDTRAWVTT
jgi:hypothetical protein